MYQLDIIMTCYRLGIPLEKVKQVLSFRDNDKAVALLMEYQQKAIVIAGSGTEAPAFRFTRMGLGPS